MKSIQQNNKAVSRKAVFSKDRRFRFKLERSWKHGKRIAFVGLNPSTADEKKDDPTIKRVIGFAESWGYSGVEMYNLFPYVTPYPKELDDNYWSEYSRNLTFHDLAFNDPKIEKIVVCWGAFDQAKNMAANFMDKRLSSGKIYCLGSNNDGSPKHPLYLKRTTQLQKVVSI